MKFFRRTKFYAINIFFIFIALFVFSLFFFCIENFQESSPPSPKHTLCLLVSAKNEEMVIKEFIEHYKWQGVEHIYLIDNGSTDNMVDVLQPYINEGYVSYYFMEEPHVQIKNYNIVYEKIKDDTKWLVVCDADEYIYNRARNQTVKDYVESIDYQSTNAIQLRWKMFGSSGHEKQPSSIRDSFLWRGIELAGEINSKSIVNTSQTQSLNIHIHNYQDSNMGIIKCPPELALNHYAIMSVEYFQKVKMTRGDINSNKNVRNMDYFKNYDHHEIEDTELKDLLLLSSNK